jgi:hypothetical protein
VKKIKSRDASAGSSPKITKKKICFDFGGKKKNNFSEFVAQMEKTMNIDEKLTEVDQRLREIDEEISRLSSLKRKLTQAKEKLKDEKYLKKQTELETNDWSQGEFGE